MSSNPYLLLQGDRQLIAVAWAVTILVSAVPDIVCAELTGAVPPGLVLAKMGLLLVLSVAALIWGRLRPLRDYFIILFVFFWLTELRVRIDFSSPALQTFFGNSVFDMRMQAEQTGKLAVSLGMIAALLAMGYKRRDFFLARGDLRAPIQPVRVLGFPKPDPWTSFGLQWAIYIAGGLAVILFLGLQPTTATMLLVLPVLPSILFYAALNALNEEITYRAPMIATLEPVGGSWQALWMSAYFFGVAHYFGTPGGILGGIASIFMGWILGKAMVETRGLFWSWWIHFLSDVVIFVFLTAALIG